MAESDYFKQQRAASLNNLQKGDGWNLDVKYFKQAMDALERAKFDVEDGIILKLQAVRQKELEQYVVKNCYQNKSYNFIQAQKCEEFHYKNDFKLGLLRSFFNDHIAKHINQYQECWQNPEFERLKTNEDRDFAFLECHDKWIGNLRENVVPELEIRARDLLQ